MADHPRGAALLHDPRLNKGTAFTEQAMSNDRNEGDGALFVAAGS
ncbi:MAG TPA: hypothetical protein VK446_12920 [Methylocystis sp.]|nr:hypothetical protein [Methylocystis sp.]